MHRNLQKTVLVENIWFWFRRRMINDISSNNTKRLKKEPIPPDYRPEIKWYHNLQLENFREFSPFLSFPSETLLDCRTGWVRQRVRLIANKNTLTIMTHTQTLLRRPSHVKVRHLVTTRLTNVKKL